MLYNPVRDNFVFIVLDYPLPTSENKFSFFRTKLLVLFYRNMPYQFLTWFRKILSNSGMIVSFVVFCHGSDEVYNSIINKQHFEKKE